MKLNEERLTNHQIEGRTGRKASQLAVALRVIELLKSGLL